MSDQAQHAFYITAFELNQAKTWQKEHDQAKHLEPGQECRYSGAIGGAYTWCFTPTSLGTVIKLQCSCGESKDLTDYDSW